jgi:hypothetical protein
MGTDIRVQVEVRRNGRWCALPRSMTPSIFGDRRPAMFSFLSGGCVTRGLSRPWLFKAALPEPRGYPKDGSEETREQARMADSDLGVHSASHLTLGELLAVDYGTEFTDVDDKPTTWDETLGPDWNAALIEMRGLGPPDDVRIVFDFSS